MRKGIITVCLVLNVFASFSQDKANDKLGNWMMYFGELRFTEKISLFTEAQLWLFEPIQNFDRLVFLAGPKLRLNENTSLIVGYGYSSSEEYNKLIAPTNSFDHRVWSQLTHKNSFNNFSIFHRYRFDQRWITVGNSDPFYLSRIRYQLKIIIPLVESKALYFATFNEVALNFSSSPFNQNRLYFALGYRINNSIKTQIGYLRLNTNNGGFNRLQFSAHVNLDFRKKEMEK